MSDTPKPQNPTLVMIERLVVDLFERAHHGVENYDEQINTLARYGDIAAEIGDDALYARSLLVRGAVSHLAGKLPQSFDYYKQAREAYHKLDLVLRVAAVENNLAHVCHSLGMYARAIERCQHGFDYCQQVDDLHNSQGKHIIAYLAGNWGSSLLASGNLEEAELRFQQTTDLAREYAPSNSAPLVDVQIGMAEIYRARKEYDKGWRAIRYAEELSGGRSDLEQKIRMALKKAHLSNSDPRDNKSAEPYYKQARQLLDEVHLPISKIELLMDEARYQHRQGNEDEAQRLVSEAREVVTSLQIESDEYPLTQLEIDS